MNKSELLTSLTDSRRQIVTVINDFSDIELIEPETLDGWSGKDVLAHLAAWEAELVTALARDVAQNKRPALLDILDGKVEEINLQWHKENEARPLDRIRDDFAGVRKQLIRQITNIPDKDLIDPKRYKWLNGQSLADYIADYANGHDQEHIDALTQWRDSRKLA
jgi:hypothetical protein